MLNAGRRRSDETALHRNEYMLSRLSGDEPSVSRFIDRLQLYELYKKGIHKEEDDIYQFCLVPPLVLSSGAAVRTRVTQRITKKTR